MYKDEKNDQLDTHKNKSDRMCTYEALYLRKDFTLILLFVYEEDRIQVKEMNLCILPWDEEERISFWSYAVKHEKQSNF